MRAFEACAVRVAMIYWIVAVALFWVPSVPSPSSGLAEPRDLLGEAAVAEAGDEAALFSGRQSKTAMKLAPCGGDACAMPDLRSVLTRVGARRELSAFQFPSGAVRGRGPPLGAIA